MTREQLDAITVAIRESLLLHRAARESRFSAETQPGDGWIDDGSRNATMSVVDALQRLGLVPTDG